MRHLGQEKRYSLGRPCTVLLGLALLLYLSLSPLAGGAESQHKGPPVSSIALFSRFAQEQGIVPSSLADVTPSPPEESLPAGLEPAAADIKVNGDFSLRPQNETTIAVNPFSPNMLVAGANDYRLGNPIGAAFYTSFDGGFTWNEGFPPFPLFTVVTGARLRLVEPPFGTGDPVLAFGKARPGSPGLTAGTPVVYYASLGVSATFCEHGIFVSRSSNGLFWRQPAVPPLLPPKGLFTPVYWDRAENCSVFNDKPWLAVDRSGGPHDGRVYVTWTRFAFNAKRYQESPILMAYSDDNGETWSDPIEVSGFSSTLCRNQVSGPAGRCDESQFSNVVVGPDGTLYLAFINQQSRGADDGFRNQYLVTKVNPDTLAVSGPFQAATLIDGRNDWPVNALGQATLCNSNFRLNSAGNLAMDASRNTLYLVFTDNRNGSPFPFLTQVTQKPPDSFACPQGTTTDADISVVESSDGGVTWSSPLRVNQDTLGNGRDQWFPFAAVATDGRVDVVFYDRRDDPSNRLTQVYLARSRDGGATWTEIRVTDVASNMNWAWPDNPLTDINENGIFIGDYNGLAIAPDGTSYPFWTDVRIGVASAQNRHSDVRIDIVLP